MKPEDWGRSWFNAFLGRNKDEMHICMAVPLLAGSGNIGETSDGRVESCGDHPGKDFISPGQGQMAIQQWSFQDTHRPRKRNFHQSALISRSAVIRYNGCSLSQVNDNNDAPKNNKFILIYLLTKKN